MRTYRIRCPEGHEEHARQRMSAPAPFYCATCGQEARIVVGATGIAPVRAPNRDGYQPGLALYPGDRSAYVDGPRALRRLIDDRKRRGLGDPLPADEILRQRPTAPGPAPEIPLED